MPRLATPHNAISRVTILHHYLFNVYATQYRITPFIPLSLWHTKPHHAQYDTLPHVTPLTTWHSDTCHATLRHAATLLAYSTQRVPHHVRPRHVTSRRTTPRHVMPRHALPRHTLRRYHNPKQIPCYAIPVNSIQCMPCNAMSFPFISHSVCHATSCQSHAITMPRHYHGSPLIYSTQRVLRFLFTLCFPGIVP